MFIACDEVAFFFFIVPIFSRSLPRADSLAAFPLASGATLADGMYLKSIPTGRGTRVPPCVFPSDLAAKLSSPSARS